MWLFWFWSLRHSIKTLMEMPTYFQYYAHHNFHFCFHSPILIKSVHSLPLWEPTSFLITSFPIHSSRNVPANIYLLRVKNWNIITRYEIGSNFNNKTPERGHWPHFGVFVVNFEHILHLFLVFLIDFEQVNVSWDVLNIALRKLCENFSKLASVWM